ncbi:MAG: extracellular solute-binding protein [Deltaproteobacteria bacterium]|nr:extracellular solute-binding protein [Deltaproteobacteria bacterium]
MFMLLLLVPVLGFGVCQAPVSGAEISLKKFTDLAAAGVRVGIVDPELGPAGVYAQQVIAKIRACDGSAAAAIEKNIVTYESHVRALLDKVLRHEVDAGFVYRSDTLKVKDKIAVIEIPTAFAVSPRYALARMQGAQAPQAALAFINWLQAPEQNGLWRRYGFCPLEQSVNDAGAGDTVDADNAKSVVVLPESLTVFAAAVFYDVLPQLVQAYKKRSGVTVASEFAGSGKLYQKIRQGAVGSRGADIFLSASPFFITELEHQGLADNGSIFMGNDLVVAVFQP